MDKCSGLMAVSIRDNGKHGTQNGKGQIYLAGGDIVSGIFQNSILVQAMPSIYEKQMEISNLSIQDLFGKKKVSEHQSTR